MVSMFPPEGGLCYDADPNLFWLAESEEDIRAGKRVCGQCPVFEECSEYVAAVQQGLNSQGGYVDDRDIFFQGVVAGKYWSVTDGRGRVLSKNRLTAEWYD